jgi:hypothetical protein
MATAGHIIASKYELVRIVGSGSMGNVWIAHHLTLGEDVALKLLTQEPSDCAEDPAIATARFRFEAQVAARLSRKTRHIVRVTDHGEEDGLAYLVMELLEGETLERRLMRGPIPLAETPGLTAQIARALAEAHAANVVHRDLKPANIFLASDEDGRLLVKLLDFGIARTIQTHQVPAAFSTGRGLVFGTPGYMSPEQANPSSKLDCRCDLWAFATVVYEMLTGEIPVSGSSGADFFANLVAGRFVPVHERDPALPAGLASFFGRAFAKSIDERFPDAQELAEAFERAIDSRDRAGMPAGPRAGKPPGRTLPITFPMRFRRRREPVASSRGTPMRHRFVLAALASAFGLVAAVGARHVAGGSNAERDTPPAAAGFHLATAADERPGDIAPAPVMLEEPESHPITPESHPIMAMPGVVASAPRSASPAPVRLPEPARHALGPAPRTPKAMVADGASRSPASHVSGSPAVTPAEEATSTRPPPPSTPIDRSAVL